jgi:hypothetical protein
VLLTLEENAGACRKRNPRSRACAVKDIYFFSTINAHNGFFKDFQESTGLVKSNLDSKGSMDDVHLGKMSINSFSDRVNTFSPINCSFSRVKADGLISLSNRSCSLYRL